MTGFRRRRVLRTVGTLATVGSIAGCTQGSLSDGNGDGETDADGGNGDGGGDGGNADGGEFLRQGRVVDYPGMVDGQASVSANEREISYGDPQRTFSCSYVYEGNAAAASQLRVSRDLSGETMAAFVAPVYDEDAGSFAYHVFANDPFVEFADWYYVVGQSTDPIDTGEAAFEPLVDGVSRTVVGPVETATVGVIDVPPSEAQNGGENVTGVVLDAGSTGSGPETAAPQVVWGFEYDAESGVLAITHEGGDTVSGGDLVVHVGGDGRTVQPFDGDVSAGDSASFDASADATVRIVWVSPDGDQSATLARWNGPDA